MLSHLLTEVTERHPRSAAIVDGDRTLTYVELRQRTQALVSDLRTRGVEHGSPVALLLPNSAEFVIGFLAIAELGAVAAPLNTHYRHDELTRFLGDSRPRLLLTIREFEPLCRPVLSRLPDPGDLLLLDEDAPPAPDRRPFRHRGHIGSSGASHGHLLYQYSSGSTGPPKRVARTHSNVMLELDSLARTLGLGAEDRFLGVTPFSHVNGLVRSMLASLSVGGTLVPLRHFRRRHVIDTIRRERISVFIGVPFMFGILAETRARDADLSSLRLCISASAPMPVAKNREFHDRYGRYVRQLYGSTETGTISVNLEQDIESTLESVGRPIDGVEVVVRREDGALADPGETGEVAVRSPFAITEYDGAPAETGPFRDGYFLTGDLGRLDERSHLYLVGRKRFLINKGGYKINPWELETLLREHPKIREAVVIGIPNVYGDEQIKAVLVPSYPCSEGEVIDYCRTRIADFKVPSVIEFRQSLPLTSTGKVLRAELR